MMKKLYLVGLLLLCLVLPFGSLAFAATFDHIVAFGDSLSDNGPGDGFGYGVSSNGDVWVDQLADSLGVGLLDMAFGGARTYGAPNYLVPPSDASFGVLGYDYGFGWQIEKYLDMSTGSADSNALYTIWIGGNDLLNISNSTEINSVIGNAVTNIYLGIKNLVDAGAENILVMNMPKLGATPLMNGDPTSSATGDMLASGFNTALDAAINPYRSAINLFEVDIFTLMQQFIDDSIFDNSTDMLRTAGVTSDSYLFWDAIHPTTYAHGMIAEAAYNEVAPVPEPTTVLLFGIGLLGLAGVSRRKK